MVWTVNWDGEFVVGGDPQRRLTPNFRFREFLQADGSARVHRELVSALQILRNRYKNPISVLETDADGLGARIASNSSLPLIETARDATHVFSSLQSPAPEDPSKNTLDVRIHTGDTLPDIRLDQVLETAFSVTSAFESGGDHFQQVTGNFDDAGLSFGPAQVNFLTGTLVPIFREFEKADEAALRACFTDPTDYQEWRQVLGSSTETQVAWGDSVSTGRNKHDVVEPWKGYLQAVGRVPAFRAVMVEEILRKYGDRMLQDIKYLQSLKPDILIDHLRCVCSLYDLAIQQGSLTKAHSQIEARVQAENPLDQFHLVRIAVEERGKRARAQYVSDTLSRRLGILNGVPETVDGRQRTNIQFYLLRNVRVGNARQLMESDVSDQLAQASKALASGNRLV